MKIKQYIYLMRLDKPIGIFLLLWPALWGLWLASQGRPHLKIVIIFVIGVILMRSAGCIINDFADRKVDLHVARTKNRPLTSGQLSNREALLLFCFLSLCAFALTFLLNKLTVGLAIIGALLSIVYPFLKRITHLPQLGLGLAFALSIPMAFAAETQTIPGRAWPLFLAAVVWPVIYDTLYAMVDREDDLKIGIKSTAILFKGYDRCLIGLLQIIFLLLLIKVGVDFSLQHFYYYSLIVVAILFSYQQFLIRERFAPNCFKAFLNNQWVGFSIFAGIVLGLSK